MIRRSWDQTPQEAIFDEIYLFFLKVDVPHVFWSLPCHWSCQKSCCRSCLEGCPSKDTPRQERECLLRSRLTLAVTQEDFMFLHIPHKPVVFTNRKNSSVKLCLHVTVFSPFFSQFEKGFNAFLWCCLRMTLKDRRSEKRYV